MVTAGVVIAVVNWRDGSRVPDGPPSLVVKGVAGGSPADDGTEDAFTEARDRSRSKNNLYQLAIALHNMHDTVGTLPPSAIRSKTDGKPLLSWRVAVLPYIEQDKLYREFKLDEPWDSPNNEKLLAKMPNLFAIPGRGDRRPFTTHYQAVVGPRTMWESTSDPKAVYGATGRKMLDATDGTSNTLLVVEALNAVP